MFFHRQGVVYLSKDQTVLCEVEQLGDVIARLQYLAQDIQQHAEQDDLDPRYTPEGINRYFKANPFFHNNASNWEEDALRNWRHLDGPELFNRYQLHAELYCSDCLENEENPTYQGFRDWLMSIKHSLEFFKNHVE